ncbi:MAG: hypothetical protein ACXVCK_08780, partial [Bdellovibrionota bacterium]
MKAFLVFTALFFASVALAAEAPKPRKVVVYACESGQDLMAKIKSCTDNKVAQAAAEACGKALDKEWANAQAELGTVLSVSQKNLDTKQQADFFHSHSDLQLAMDKLESLIEITQENAEKLANYPRVMFDNPYAEAGLKGSSSCYKNPFKGVAKVVADLDQKIEQAEAALAATDDLRAVSQARDDGISASLTRGAAHGVLAAKPVPVAA